ncbi:other/TTK protein kinase [Coprinopsis cinerea okayama7|uniref:Other/TTK protein kinase n=1 Tax=Coprinopsis cinerea (strain Okayama-7 / 130 / ATCC MYA-4618 / FGSC 9003) TaxID=240176 RepID=A8NS59_COPC7|nr:other/TTK protein kinase [Coprinopsis cinerea okayama7\|eukprot:XP_001835945.2 other/TTK protein kinase [Coprinopsis cinerea okayama7\
MSTSPSISPPRTPNDNRPTASTSNSPSSDDSSIIDDLSFDYVYDDNGNVVRLSRKSNSTSPPTDQESLPDSALDNDSPAGSPLNRQSLSRSESAQSILQGTSAAATDPKPARPFQRVASTPSYLLPTAAATSRAAVTRGGPRRIIEDSHNRERQEPIVRSRQTFDYATRDSYAHQEEKENILAEMDERPQLVNRRNSPPLIARSTASRFSSARISYSTIGGSLNGRPLADVPVQRTARQPPTGLTRPGRLMKSSLTSLKYSTSNQDRLSDVVESSDYEHKQQGLPEPNPYAPPASDTEPEDEPLEPSAIPLRSSLNPRQRKELNINAQAASLAQSGSNRPRRSASLSDALYPHDDYQLQVAAPPTHGHSRPGTSLGLNAESGPRRVYPEERERQELEAHKKLRREHEDDRQSPSPTHGHPQHQRLVANGHRRRDSDTLRGLAPPNSAGTVGSPTVMDMPNGRPSPTGHRFPHGRSSPAATVRGRQSPQTVKGRVSPPATKGRVSPANAGNRLGVSRDAGKHRRSPTAPEPPTTSGQIGGHEQPPGSKTWGGSEREDEFDPASSGEKDREKERERQLEAQRERRERREQQQQQQPPPQPPPQQLQPYAQVPQAIAQPAAPAPQPPIPAPNQLNRHIVVNKKAYARIDIIGKGGSSRVFRVLNHANELYAIKRVSLDKTDAETMSGYMNEIALLKRLEGNSRIIRLIDSEVKPGPGGSKGHLLLVMECGEIDLAKLLQEQMKEPLNMVWVSYYWQQMLQAVHVIHEEKIVHSDLKPANFVLVKGQLKLIDFGIANAIANDTTNIQRDHQIGTVNYMSPEAIELPDGMRRLKVGRPSDVWSLGIILYQMVYGHPPFQHLSVYQKMKAIPDLSHVIEYPEYTVPSIPAKTSSNGTVEPPKRLEHLKRRVRADVIRGIKSCLCRNPKERATIPELLEQPWLGLTGNEPEPVRPRIEDMLGEKETLINPYYMAQLMQYCVKLAREDKPMDAETLQKDAEVRELVVPMLADN